MPVLVDGHNLIGQVPGLSLAAPDDEAQLVLLLRRYATRKRGRRVVVVFDHGVYGHPHKLNGYGVECHFAKSPGDADRELIRRIRAIVRCDAWQVITSDRAVAGAARARGIAVVSSQAFARQLLRRDTPEVTQNHTPGGQHEHHKERRLSEREIAEWLRLFGAEDEESDDEA